MTAALQVCRTRRFAVVSTTDDVDTHDCSTSRPLSQTLLDHVPTISLADVLGHEQRGCAERIRAQLQSALAALGYVFLTTPKSSSMGQLIDAWRTSLHEDVFPGNDVNGQRNAAGLETSDVVYVSEKGTPMYRLGYELTEDCVREIFRIAGGQPDDCRLPAREQWLRGLGFLRHLTDRMLELILQQTPLEPRPHSGAAAWRKRQLPETLRDRPGDFSVLYAMHYFNQADLELPEPGVAVKAHVDPSLLVVEPFLCPETTGLQVWDRVHQCWLEVDGPDSPAVDVQGDHEVMVVFLGKALAAATGWEPTLHRVVTGHGPRKTIIYEQKYAEYF